MSAIGLPNSTRETNTQQLCISALADYRREDFYFRRNQSVATASAEWEHRAKPLKSWMQLAVPVAAGLVVTAGILPFVF
jgi:hypothetical protein